jgi:hypothetical protein
MGPAQYPPLKLHTFALLGPYFSDFSTGDVGDRIYKQIYNFKIHINI